MTYEELDGLLIDKDILYGINSDGEGVIAQRKKDYILTITSQNNGWLRKNYYYSNGDYEELYEK